MEGLAKRVVKAMTRCIVVNIFQVLGGGGRDRATKFHFNSIFMVDHIFPSAPIKPSQNLSVLARVWASNTLPQNQYALGAFGIHCWNKSSSKVWIHFYWLLAGMLVYMCDYYAVQKYKWWLQINKNKRLRQSEVRVSVEASGSLLQVVTTWEHPGEATNLDPVEHQLVPQTVVTYNPTPELRLLSPHSIVKQSPSQRGVHRTQDLKRNKQKMFTFHVFIHAVPLSRRQTPRLSYSTTCVWQL